MNQVKQWAIAGAVVTALTIGASTITQAIQLGDGTIRFVQPPQIVSAVTTDNDVQVWGGTFYFTLDLPEQAGEPLSKVVLNQELGVDEIDYEVKETIAFEGDRRDRGNSITISNVAISERGRQITITFDPPVPPGRQMTIGLKPLRNPLTSGTYLFGMTAFPPGEQAVGQFIGYGRLQFYDGGDFSD